MRGLELLRAPGQHQRRSDTVRVGHLARRGAVQGVSRAAGREGLEVSTGSTVKCQDLADQRPARARQGLVQRLVDPYLQGFASRDHRVLAGYSREEGGCCGDKRAVGGGDGGNLVVWLKRARLSGMMVGHCSILWGRRTGRPCPNRQWFTDGAAVRAAVPVCAFVGWLPCRRPLSMPPAFLGPSWIRVTPRTAFQAPALPITRRRFTVRAYSARGAAAPRLNSIRLAIHPRTSTSSQADARSPIFIGRGKRPSLINR